MSGLGTSRGTHVQQDSTYIRSVFSIERSSTVDTYIIGRGHLGQLSVEQPHILDLTFQKAYSVLLSEQKAARSKH